MLINFRSLYPQLRVALLSWSVSPHVIFLFGNLFLGGKNWSAYNNQIFGSLRWKGSSVWRMRKMLWPQGSSHCSLQERAPWREGVAEVSGRAVFPLSAGSDQPGGGTHRRLSWCCLVGGGLANRPSHCCSFSADLWGWSKASVPSCTEARGWTLNLMTHKSSALWGIRVWWLLWLFACMTLPVCYT